MVDKWIKDAHNWAEQQFDYILKTYIAQDFVEFVGSMGGDVVTYRYYSCGRIGEK